MLIEQNIGLISLRDVRSKPPARFEKKSYFHTEEKVNVRWVPRHDTG